MERAAALARLRRAAQRARTGASATRWTGPGRSATCRRANTGGRRATSARRCACIDRELKLIACGSSNRDHADVSACGIARCSRSATTRWTPSRCTATTATRRSSSGNSTRALPGDEPGHGAADSRDRRRLRLRAGPATNRRSGSGCRSTSGTSGIARAAATPPTGSGRFAPKLLEEVYNLEDALLVGGFVNSLLAQSDRVRVACLAQILNVIAPLVTNKTSVLRQSIYYPYAWALQYAKRPGARSGGGVARPIRSRRRGCARTSRATTRCRSSTWRRPSTRRTGRLRC